MPDTPQWERDLDDGTARVHPDTGEFYRTTSWAAVDLEPYKRGERVIEPPLFLNRDDGRALVYPGRPHVFFGESESLKSWAALMACKSVVVAGYKALYVDFEGSEASFVERARHVGIADGHIGKSLNYVRPTEALRKDAEVDFWHREVDLFEPTLVVLDGVTEFYALQGWDINKATDAATFQKTFAFHKYGIASIAIDHTAKDAGRGALGSQHKRAGLDGAEYLFESVTHGGRGGTSVAKVRVTKDRHGFVRAWAENTVGKLVVAPDGVTLEPPKLSDLVNPKSDAQDRVREFLGENPGSSGRKVQQGTRLKRERVSEALSGLELLGEARNTGTLSQGSWELTDGS
jgi:AAA domain